MDEPDRSPAVDQLPEDLQLEYLTLRSQLQNDIEGVEGMRTIHNMVLERYCFMYVALKHQERQWGSLDPQRYNQFTQLWIKVGSDLLARLQEIYEKGALNDLFAEKVMTIVVEEVGKMDGGQDALGRIRSRLESAKREAAKA